MDRSTAMAANLYATTGRSTVPWTAVEENRSFMQYIADGNCPDQHGWFLRTQFYRQVGNLDRFHRGDGSHYGYNSQES
jgi:hypothetical protein